MHHPLVSILVPVYNAGSYLRPALKSVLAQTYTNLEVLIVDDGSTDGCLGEIEDLTDSRIRLLRKEHSGRAATLNYALKQISGEFFAIQDADDLSDLRRIERQVRPFLEDSSLAAVFTGYDIILNEKRMAPRYRHKSIEECRNDIQDFRMPSHDPTAMFRWSLAGRFEFEETLQVGAGWDHILRVGETFPMLVIGECLYSYRISPTSNTRTDPMRRRKGVGIVLERALNRRGSNVCSATLLQAREEKAFNGREHGVVTHFMESVLDQKADRKASNAIRTAWSCARLHPLTPEYYKPLVYSVVPTLVIKCYRSAKKC
ncbi:MAG: glycosyltransferase family 2 protein [Verrucomicrobia bacterium]|nr:glycosyltransferase family 2 protein [Verrucomicrobiota bacterium]